MDKEILQWFIDEANNGNVKAMESLAFFYSDGYKVEKDDAKAYKYFKMAAEKGNIRAKYMVGMLYEKDTALATTYISEAADAGFAKAQYEMGLMYKDRKIGFFGNDKKAFKYFEKASKQGHGWAQIELVDAYLLGIGVRQNLQEGIFWLSCAYCHGLSGKSSDIDVGNAAVERINSLIHSEVPGGSERIEQMVEEVKKRYPQYIKEPEFIKKDELIRLCEVEEILKKNI